MGSCISNTPEEYQSVIQLDYTPKDVKILLKLYKKLTGSDGILNLTRISSYMGFQITAFILKLCSNINNSNNNISINTHIEFQIFASLLWSVCTIPANKLSNLVFDLYKHPEKDQLSIKLLPILVNDILGDTIIGNEKLKIALEQVDKNVRWREDHEHISSEALSVFFEEKDHFISPICNLQQKFITKSLLNIDRWGKLTAVRFRLSQGRHMCLQEYIEKNTFSEAKRRKSAVNKGFYRKAKERRMKTLAIDLLEQPPEKEAPASMSPRNSAHKKQEVASSKSIKFDPSLNKKIIVQGKSQKIRTEQQGSSGTLLKDKKI